MFYKLLADAVIAVHLGYVAFVITGQLLILIGLACRWSWVRNLRFRVLHLVMVEVVALEGFFGIICPMTHWEDALRSWAAGKEYVAVSTPPPAPYLTPEPVPAKRPPPADTQAQQPVATPPVPFPAPPESGKVPANEKVETISTSEAVASAPVEDETFVGRLLGSILYLEVPQRVLDRWYVGFGLASLALFVAFPPNRKTWTRLGLAGLVLFWIGAVFSIFIWLLLGASMMLAGIGCGWLGRKYAI